MSPPTPYASFTVASAGLCYGAMHNIIHGAIQPVQPLPSIRPQRSGTVAVHRLEYNTAALNGTWHAYQLTDCHRQNRVVGWFLCHSSTDPVLEIAKILRISGSPYEANSGDFQNTEATESAGVLVISRYDWGYYDRRQWETVGEGAAELDDFLAQSNSVGIIDYASADDAVQTWRDAVPSRRAWLEGGCWLYCPESEDIFGRFGFTEDKRFARSFLFFSGCTNFFSARLADCSAVLKREETEVEMISRSLREVYAFSGLKWLHEDEAIRMKRPLALVGPFSEREHLFSIADIEAIRALPSTSRPQFTLENPTDVDFSESFAQFVPGWERHNVDLLNEMILSWLATAVLSKRPDTSAKTIFQRHAEYMCCDYYCYRYFKQHDLEPIAGVDVINVHGKIAAFLFARGWNVEGQYIEGLYRAIEYLLLEVIELASRAACGSSGIMGYQIRNAAVLGDDLDEMLCHSAVFWDGRNAADR